MTLQILPLCMSGGVAETAYDSRSVPTAPSRSGPMPLIAIPALGVHSDALMSTDHRKLSAFQLADEFAIRVYTATRSFHGDERFGVRSQIRRAVVNVPTNIVEGCARDSDREHARYYEIALGSARETIYLLDLASRLELIDPTVAQELAAFGGRVAAALAALRKSISQP